MNQRIEKITGQDNFVLYAAVFGAAFIIMMLSWSSYSSKGEIDLRRSETEILPRFTEAVKHGGIAIRLPDLGVLGPEGKIVKIHDNRTKYTVLSLWNHDGIQTKQHISSLKSLYDRMPERTDWQFFAVSVDDVKDLDKTYDFISNLQSREIAEYHDYEAVMMDYFEINKDDLPVTFLLDSRNRILYELKGAAQMGDSHMAEFLKQVALNY